MKMKTKTTLIVILVLLAVVSCRTRLKSILYEVNDESRLGLVHDETYYQTGFELNDNYEQNAMKYGSGIVMTSVQKATHPESGELITGLLKAVGEIEYRLYVHLPFINQGDSIDLAGNSICRLIGLYQFDDSLKHYSCREGFIRIDTAKSARFHAYLSGKYFNISNDSLILEGDLSARLKK